MPMKRWILLLLPAATIAVLTGCGGSTFNVQNPQGPPPPNVTVTVQTTGLTNGSVPVNGAVTLTATVQGTSAQVADGVAWYISCSGGAVGACGTLSSPSSASGAAITYTAPASISSNTLTAHIVAYAEAQQTANSISSITITTFNSSLAAGNYVLQAQGADSSLNPYQVAGVIKIDGQGNITGGEQTANYISSGLSLSDTVTGGSYFLGNDGRGTITIQTGDTNIGGNGVETFAFVYLSSSQALISQMDIGSAATGASATGTLDLQTSTATPTGGYAFVVNGTYVAKTSPVAFGGVFNIDSPNTISGNGSVTDEIVGKKLNATALGLSGTLTAPDQFGAVILNLMAPFGAANKAIPLTFAGYIIDATHIELIETDDASGSGFGMTGGVAIGQGGATGTFTGNNSFSGTYVFGIPGTDLSTGNSSFAPNTLTAAGLFTADGSGNLTNGFADTFLDLNGVQVSGQTGAQISAAFTGTYSVDSTGTGRAASTAITFNPEPKDDYSPAFFFYLTGITGEGEPAALVLQSGDTHYPSIGTGVAYLQSGSPSFNGDYGFSFTQEQGGGGENDGTAQLNADATTAPPSLSGVADVNLDFGANQDQPFTGTFATPTATAPFAGILVGTNNSVSSSAVFFPQIAVDYYFIDPNHGFFVETDLVNATSPEQTGQVSLGYYAARTPVCAGCP